MGEQSKTLLIINKLEDFLLTIIEKENATSAELALIPEIARIVLSTDPISY